MGSVGDCVDNAMCESFFATLECELLDRTRFAMSAEASTAVFDFIEAWYNPHRRHSAIGYRSPHAFESAAEDGARGLRPRTPLEMRSKKRKIPAGRSRKR
jgi:putative transposase